ncbi:MAG: hypothetical protein N3B21_11265 [Clostridia bacterium]|nr:hypothetical protein [Clostridia bacterium]
MSTKRILKLAGLNIGIAILNIALFSPGLLNIRMGGSDALSTAIGGTAIIMSFVVFIYGNYKLISQKDRTIQIIDIKSPEDCSLALKQAYGKKTFDNDISIILEQVERLQKKKEKIRAILLQKFNIIDTGYERFNSTIFDVEYVFYTNIKSILNKINVFDEEDYESIRKDDAEKKFSAKFIASKLSIYNEYISFVKEAIEDNEEIILKLDALLLEISKFNSLEAGEVDNMNEIKELDELIRKSKYYK